MTKRHQDRGPETRGTRGGLHTRRRRARGAAYVEVLVVVGIVVTLGMLAVTLLGQSSADHAGKEASCIKSFACGGGAPGSAGPSGAAPTGGATPTGGAGPGSLASLVGNPSGRSTGPAPNELGRGANGRFGDDRTGLSGAARDTGTLAGVVGSSAGGAVVRARQLDAIDSGRSRPDPDSRLGAYDATKGYPRGTVGNAVHNAIGTLYAALGTYGEEKIGRVFNSPEARALFDQPVDSEASLRMAQLEHEYWEKVRTEDGYSGGGQLGSVFSPGVRDVLQRRVFGR